MLALGMIAAAAEPLLFISTHVHGAILRAWNEGCLMILHAYDKCGWAVSLLLMSTRQGIGHTLYRAEWRSLGTRWINSLISGQRHACPTNQEDADDARSFLQHVHQ
jgi:hypothetical protein